ncbi:hypothetical protein [Glaciimonas immobilis]|uniref:hypothetical protein n=1 Tax=Glaciimonas immobilis TaxID=728004 RepID=UPI001ADA1320|nr:hypothetical protein [Glaciimonas immobilis]
MRLTTANLGRKGASFNKKRAVGKSRQLLFSDKTLTPFVSVNTLQRREQPEQRGAIKKTRESPRYF